MSRTRLSRLLFLIGWTALAAPVGAFDSGSTGARGPIDVPAGASETIQLPADGIIHATTVTLGADATLSFIRNELNTPVYLLATGDVTLNGTGSIASLITVKGSDTTDSDGGVAGPGGFDGGKGGFEATPPGPGQGPGGGAGGQCNTTVAGAGSAGHRTVPSGGSTNHGAAYGSTSLVPIVGGSGGGGCFSGTTSRGGAGGGGAIVIASNTKISFTGVVNADGAFSNGSASAHGSGGAIRLVAPIVRGSGVLRARGAEGVFSGPIQQNGEGRIRIDTLDHTELTATLNPSASATIGSAMYVFLPNAPRLDIVEAAGEPVGSAPVQVTLPLGAPAAQTVIVRAQNFTGTVPITVAVLPESGARALVNADIAMNGQAEAQVTVPVTIPPNTVTQIQAWTR
jgi:hypothetical protein